MTATAAKKETENHNTLSNEQYVVAKTEDKTDENITETMNDRYDFPHVNPRMRGGSKHVL